MIILMFIDLNRHFPELRRGFENWGRGWGVIMVMVEMVLQTLKTEN